MIDSATVATDELRGWLLTGCDLADNDRYRAGVDLLDFAGLLDRRDIRAHITIDPDDSGVEARVAWVDWTALGADPDLGPLAGAARQLLELAVSIGGGTPVDLQNALSGLGAAHSRAVLAAVARALGIAEDVQISDTPAHLERKRAHDERIAALLSETGSAARA